MIRSLLVLLVLSLATILVFAVKKKPEKKKAAAEIWHPLNADPWQELDLVTQYMKNAMPYTQQVRALLLSENDALLEERTFTTAYYDNATMLYRIEGTEMVNTRQWQAIIDHDQQYAAINPPNVIASGVGFDLGMLKKLFTDNGFSLEVKQNQKGQKMLSSDNFTNGTMTGMQLVYDASTGMVISVRLGMPHIEQDPDGEKMPDSSLLQGLSIKTVSESLELEYKPLEKLTAEQVKNGPDSYFTIKKKQLKGVDKRFEGYRVINNIQ
ncbi:hypothetical protein [Sediminibacterium ginsengisoli]|nr:hypothetical protein [Sediminibacterium ginsengisoli]